MFHRCSWLALVLLLAAPVSLLAAEGGYSNYVPGTYGDFGMALAPAESLTYKNDFYYYSADEEESVRSGRLELGADLSFLINFSTLVWKPGLSILGGEYAAGTVVPLMYVDIESSLRGPAGGVVEESDDTFGLGDVTLIPLILYWNTGNWFASFGQYVVTPTGSYDADDPINTGLNYWSFDTNVAVSYLNPQTGWEFAFNLGHIYNTENGDTDYQTGREIHADAAANLFLSESFAVGLQGFWLKQVSGDSGDGALLGSFKAEAAGIGPAGLWVTSVGEANVTLIAKWLHEFNVDRRLEGDHLMASFVVDF